MGIYHRPIMIRSFYNGLYLYPYFTHEYSRGTEYDTLQRLFTQVLPLSSELVSSGQVVSLQSIAKWFGIGLMLFVAIIAVLLVALLIIVLNAILSSDGLFA